MWNCISFFWWEMLLKNFTQSVGKYSVNYINGRESSSLETETSKIIWTLPDHVNGLEFKCVILIAVDEGRVPQSGLFDISSSFLKYSALNKLYLSCSRAQYSVLVLGSSYGLDDSILVQGYIRVIIRKMLV